MRIGVDACCWSNRRGFGRFTRELLTAIAAVDRTNEYLFFTDQATALHDGFPPSAQKIIVSTEIQPTEAASASGRRSLRDLWAMSRQVMRHRVDLFFFPAVYSYFPIINRTKVIVTLHDVIADHHPALVFPSKKLQLFWKLKQSLAIKQSDLILTVSENSKQEIVDYFGIPSSRVRVITEAARAVFKPMSVTEETAAVLARHGLDRRVKFLLYVGGISPHKNLKTLVDAFRELTLETDLADLKLVLVGDCNGDSFYSDYSSLRAHIEELGLGGRVVFTGYVEDEHLAQLYNAALLLVFPSLEEGFGLPAVEAMACGTPVVASNRGSLPEIVGESGRFFDPCDERAMAAAIRTVLRDGHLQQNMRESGLTRARQFMWDKAAQDTLAIFGELTGQ